MCRSKHSIILLALLTLVVVITGCEEVKFACFLQPTYTLASKTNDDRILGDWVSSGEQQGNLTVTTNSSGAYKLQVQDEHDKMQFDGVLFRVGTQFYMDVTSEEDTNDMQSIKFLTRIPGHLMASVAIDNDELKLNLMDCFGFCDFLKTHPGFLEYYDDGVRVVVTSSSEQISNALTNTNVVSALFQPDGVMIFKHAPAIK